MPASRPNIVLILADDMGFSDIGGYGSEIRTPHLDRLAASGVRFTQFYNCARCCPTRASLLTGLYPHQAGVGHMVADRGLPAYQGYLNDRCVTIAEVLRQAGYRTAMAGKWHVGGAYTVNDPRSWRPGSKGHPLPVTRGFDRHWGTLAGGGSYYDPPTLIHNRTFIKVNADDFYYTDAIADKAVAFIEEAATQSLPFFTYVAYTAPHWPLHAPQEDIDRYRGTYDGGWDALRTARHESLKAAGIVSDRWAISARDDRAPPWDDVKPKAWESLRMAVYAAQVDRMDRGIGRILDALERLSVDRDTLVMFLSDNGGCAEFLAEDGGRPSRFRYDIPTRDGRPMRIGNTPAIAPGPADTFASYDLPWANASNTPFRLFKHWVHEGGIATPFIARWPGVTVPGGLVNAPSHVIDVMATCLDAAGASYPSTFDGRDATPLEGASRLPLMRGSDGAETRPLFWEHEGNRAVRLGPWKLVSKHPGDWELYDMSRDRTETTNLAASNEGKRNELADLYTDWAGRCGVVPWDDLGRR